MLQDRVQNRDSQLEFEAGFHQLKFKAELQPNQAEARPERAGDAGPVTVCCIARCRFCTVFAVQQSIQIIRHAIQNDPRERAAKPFPSRRRYRQARRAARHLATVANGDGRHRHHPARLARPRFPRGRRPGRKPVLRGRGAAARRADVGERVRLACARREQRSPRAEYLLDRAGAVAAARDPRLHAAELRRTDPARVPRTRHARQERRRILRDPALGRARQPARDRHDARVPAGYRRGEAAAVGIDWRRVRERVSQLRPDPRRLRPAPNSVFSARQSPPRSRSG